MTDPAAPDRLPPLAPEQMSPAQQAVARTMAEGPRGVLRGPFVPMLRSPELTDRTQALGEYIRYRSAVPERLREFAILVTARHWDQPFEWKVHAPLARKAGVARAAIEDLAAGRRPAKGPADELAVYDFCLQLHRAHEVDDEVYRCALKVLGEQGVVDLSGLCGYYAWLAMMLNVARTPTPQPWFEIPD